MKGKKKFESPKLPVTRLEQQITELNRKIRRLECLNKISNIYETYDSLGNILQKAANLIPGGCRYPEHTCVRIEYQNHHYDSFNYRETQWKQKRDITINGQRRGHIAVGYLLQIDGKGYEAFQPDRSFIDDACAGLSNIIFQKQALMQAQESLNRLHLVIQNMPVMMDAFDEDGNIIVWNLECERISGFSAHEMIGNPDALKRLYPDSDVLERRRNQLFRGGEEPENWECRIRCKDGRYKTVILSNVCGKFQIPGWAAWGIGLDVTPIRQAQTALKESKQRLSQIVNFLPDATLAIDRDGRVIVWNHAIEQMTGIKSEDMLGKNNFEYSLPFYGTRRPIAIDMVCNPKNYEDLKNEYSLIRKEKDCIIGESKLVSFKGRNTYLWGKAGPIYDADGNITGAIESIRDITEQKQSEKQIHDLTRRLMATQENERQRISRYLHDRLAQDLSSLKIGCETLFDAKMPVPDSVRRNIQKWSGILYDTITVIRDLSYDLHPSGLEQLGLPMTLNKYCEEFSDKTGIQSEFITAGLEQMDVNYKTRINLFRVVQEALNNIAQHAAARHVTVKLVRSYPNIILRIEDDGKGFDTRKIMTSAASAKRMGLRSMKERIFLLKGTFNIQSEINKGTRITIEIPCSKFEYLP